MLHKKYISTIVVLKKRKSNLFMKKINIHKQAGNEVYISNYWGVMIISDKHIGQ